MWFDSEKRDRKAPAVSSTENTQTEIQAFYLRKSCLEVVIAKQPTMLQGLVHYPSLQFKRFCKIS